MAEVKEEEQQKKGGILKIILFVIGGILLIILGLGIGYFIFGGEPEQDPSQEVNQIIEGEPKVKDDQNKDKNTDETNEEGIITKNVKTVPDVDAYETTYFEFPGDFTTNLQNSKKFLQISVGVSTQYDEKDSIGKRYRRQDAIGTPYSLTIDHDSLQDNSVTIRDRDSMTQKRINISELETFFQIPKRI